MTTAKLLRPEDSSTGADGLIDDTLWATPPPIGTPLSARQREMRDQLEERQRNGGDERVLPAVERVREEQRARAAAIARQFGLSDEELAAFAAPYRAALQPHQERLLAAQRDLQRATEGRRRGAALLEEKAATIKRFVDAEQAAAEQFAADCEAALVSGEVPNPYYQWNADDAVAQRRATIEHRGAVQALERLDAMVASAQAAIHSATCDLRRAVDALISERCGEPLLERFEAALNEAERLRVEVGGYRGIDSFGVLGMRGINRSLEQPVVGSTLPSSTESGIPGETPSIQGALHVWRQRRNALLTYSSYDLPDSPFSQGDSNT